MKSDATAWARGVAGRTRRLAGELARLGYRFHDPAGVLPGPDPQVELALTELVRLVGPVPTVLAEFYRTVGSIDLNGLHPQWLGCEYPDPLVVEPIESVLQEARDFAQLSDPATEYWGSESGVFRAPVGPDALHKAGLSGGMWYGVEVPSPIPDPIVLEEPHRLPFSEYVEVALAWGGFPGLERCSTHTWPLQTLQRAAQAG
jgi:hypothetical protein